MKNILEYIESKKPELLEVFEALNNSSTDISELLARAGMDGNLGYNGGQNEYGEDQKKIDELSNDVLINNFKKGGSVSEIYSEELAESIKVRSLLNTVTNKKRFKIVFDPLDGSGNIDNGLNVGTIFGIFDQDSGFDGREMVAAGYILYGARMTLVLTLGDGTVQHFNYDSRYDIFKLVDENMRIPEDSNNYGVNDGGSNQYTEVTKKFIEKIKESGKAKCRNGSCMVADVHRFMIDGGVFMYPADNKRPKGKLRQVYEVNPMAMVVENAGGMAVTSEGHNPLDQTVDDHGALASIIIGSKNQVQTYLDCLS